MPETKGLGQSRGNCLTGGTVAATFKPLMSKTQLLQNIIYIPNNNISFDNAYQILPEVFIGQKLVHNSKHKDNSNIFIRDTIGICQLI